jgi:3-isopropylmalate/(R)-2-methylmalate dehydratase small subunit
LPAVEAPDAAALCRPGDEFEIDLTGGSIHNLTQGRVIQSAPLDPRAVELLAAGGLIPYLKRRFAAL